MTQIGFKSNTGVIRNNNEDACFVIPSHDVYVVADGVGGNNAGEIASRTAVRGIAEYVAANPIEECADEEAIYNYFSQCLEQVNDEIYQMGRKHKENKGMATTAVIACVKDDTAYIINIGDSRAYLYRGGRIMQITVDHTYVNELLKTGMITTEEAKNHSQKNVITRALGAEPAVMADFFQASVEKGDILMLCSDGLYGEVPERKLEEILDRQNPMPETCARLVEEAIRSGGRDNITVVCLKI
ncbi:MAG: Stp1/IreP family PP2C-type Ser/Thr phosphatase [Firmicutes bacterium]|jgi:serine/threonine protein phosphatase PrpC|nr:Stp1/IreP family PP2C-type Ser/Thr phosphatase [Bacillota bacterium]NBI63117.1 Stp1/IreP family PP2C-type Ser/Thr phosphatase [Clostridiales bacterium]